MPLHLSFLLRFSILLVGLVSVFSFPDHLADQLVQPGSWLNSSIKGFGAAYLVVGLFTCSHALIGFLLWRKSVPESTREKLDNALASIPGPKPLIVPFTSNRDTGFATGFGAHATIFLSSSLIDKLSQPALQGAIAHEITHIRELHMAHTAGLFALIMMLKGLLSLSPLPMLVMFLLVMGVMRQAEYHADAGAARLVGTDKMLAALNELNELHPEPMKLKFLELFQTHPNIERRRRRLLTPH